MNNTFSPDNYYPPTREELETRETELLTTERVNNMVRITREKRESEERYNQFIQSLVTSSASE